MEANWAVSDHVRWGRLATFEYGMASLKRTPASHHSPTRYVLSVYGKDTAYTDSRLSLGEVLGIQILLSGSNPDASGSCAPCPWRTE